MQHEKKRSLSCTISKECEDVNLISLIQNNERFCSVVLRTAQTESAETGKNGDNTLQIMAGTHTGLDKLTVGFSNYQALPVGISK